MVEINVTKCRTCPFMDHYQDHGASSPLCGHPDIPRAMMAFIPNIDIIDPRCPMREGREVTVKLDVMSLVKEVPETPESERNVHTEHCCIVHGCKYSDDDCPVETKKQRQSYMCEACSWDSEWG